MHFFYFEIYLQADLFYVGLYNITIVLRFGWFRRLLMLHQYRSIRDCHVAHVELTSACEVFGNIITFVSSPKGTRKRSCLCYLFVFTPLELTRPMRYA